MRGFKFVQPFYLKMMRLNSIEYGADLLPAIIEAGREATPTDVVALLNDPWRASVMGAWFALLFDDEHVTESVLQALSSSSGSLDSPPLAVAATVLAGSRALSSLQTYAIADLQYRWGACRFVAAAIHYLDGPTSPCHPGDGDERNFAAMLAVANQLRDGWNK